jgi:hypothetical protein
MARCVCACVCVCVFVCVCVPARSGVCGWTTVCAAAVPPHRSRRNAPGVAFSKNVQHNTDNIGYIIPHCVVQVRALPVRRRHTAVCTCSCAAALSCVDAPRPRCTPHTHTHSHSHTHTHTHTRARARARHTHTHAHINRTALSLRVPGPWLLPGPAQPGLLHAGAFAGCACAVCSRACVCMCVCARVCVCVCVRVSCWCLPRHTRNIALPHHNAHTNTRLLLAAAVHREPSPAGVRAGVSQGGVNAAPWV